MTSPFTISTSGFTGVTSVSIDDYYMHDGPDVPTETASQEWGTILNEYVVFLNQQGWQHNNSSVNSFRLNRVGGLNEQNTEALRSISSSAFVGMTATIKKNKYLEMPEVPIIDLPMKRRVTQPRFKINYETVKDFQLRLANSIVHVGQLPYYVREIIQDKDDVLLIVEDEKKSKGKITYNKNQALDLRTPEPQYLMLDSYTVRLTRPPMRQQVQGLHNHNSVIERVGSREGGYHWENPYELLWALKEGSQIIQWDLETTAMMLKYRALKTLRLSANIAVFREGNDILVEYKGRRLGELKDKSVKCDELDVVQPWIKKDIQEVNLKLEAA